MLVICGACASVAPTPVEPADFQLRGKLGVLDGGESFSARFVWRQHGAGFTIDLWGPLGQGRIRLAGDDERLAVVDGKGVTISEGDHGQVMYAHLGWTLPLQVLPDWVLGEPGAGALSQQPEYDPAGHLVAFEQLDWTIAYAQHRKIVGDQGVRWLPRKITASKGEYRVRLVISEWQI
jgi:outer membrane lipoprotein LolB